MLFRSIFINILLSSILFFSCNNTQTSENNSSDEEAPELQIPQTLTGFSYAEAVTADDMYIYVSNIGKTLAPTLKDGDGYITRLNKYGQVLDSNFFGSGFLNAPKGLRVIDRVLYIADVDRIVGFDIYARDTISTVFFDSTKFLNDVEVRDENTLFVSATDINKVFEFDIRTQQVTELNLQSMVNRPNGLHYDEHNNLLYVACRNDEGDKASLVAVNLSDGLSTTELLNYEGVFDGLDMIDNKILISDWGVDEKGKLLLFNPATGNVEELDVQGELSGPAEFYLDADYRQIWIPNLLKGTILVSEISN